MRKQSPRTDTAPFTEKGEDGQERDLHDAPHALGIQEVAIDQVNAGSFDSEPGISSERLPAGTVPHVPLRQKHLTRSVFSEYAASHQFDREGTRPFWRI